MGTSLSRSIHIEDEPIDKPDMYVKFKDQSRPIRGICIIVLMHEKILVVVFSRRNI